MARRQWCFKDADRALLLEETAARPEWSELHALVARARRTAELPGLWTLSASKLELFDLWELVDELMDGQTNPQRYEQLDGMLETLDLTIDGI
jgi:hypothetical protein